MKKLKKIGIILIILGFSLIGLSFLFSYNTGETEKNGTNENKKLSYSVDLIDSENFVLRSDVYENYLKVFIISKAKYSRVNIEYKCYDENNKLVEEFTQKVNNINAGEEIVCDNVIDLEKVKVVKVKVIDAIFDDTVNFLDKDKIIFIVNDIRNGDDVTVHLSANNPFNQEINSILGYLHFYQGDKIVKAVPFNIEKVASGANILTDVSVEDIKKYDNIEIIINSIS